MIFVRFNPKSGFTAAGENRSHPTLSPFVFYAISAGKITSASAGIAHAKVSARPATPCKA
jgi:hypothetical protein